LKNQQGTEIAGWMFYIESSCCCCVSRCKKRSKAAVTVRRQWMMIHFDFLSLTKLTGHSKKTSRPQMRERMEARKHRRIKKKKRPGGPEAVSVYILLLYSDFI
jgi:hypothetical protein